MVPGRSSPHRVRRTVDLMARWSETEIATMFAEAQLKIRSYGKLADLFGAECEVSMNAPCTVAALRQQLIENHPEAADVLRDKRIRVVLADVVMQDQDIIPRGEVPEFLAPVSGG